MSTAPLTATEPARDKTSAFPWSPGKRIAAMTYDGRVRPLSLDPSDGKLWRRLVFDAPDRMTVECMDESVSTFGSAIDPAGKTLSLSGPGNAKRSALLTAARQASGRMTLDGSVESHQVHLDLEAMDLKRFLLLGDRFHWIQEYPFNR